MKRHELLKHIQGYGCQLLREGGNHSIYFNPASKKTSSVPHHSEISDKLAQKICKDLGIPKARG